MHPLGSQQLDEGLDFLWLNLLAPRDPQVPALPRPSQHLRGKRKEISTQRMNQIHKPHDLAEVQTTGGRSMQRLDVARAPAGPQELVAPDQQQLECAGSRAA